MIQAVLWDNDGVLVDSERLFFETTRAAFAQLGLELTREIWGRQYLGEGKTSRQIAAMLGSDPERAAKAMEERNEKYLQVIGQSVPLRPKVRETLGALHGRVKMAIVTGCHRHQLKLMHATSGLLDLFDATVTGDECPNPKPHPELYLAGLKLLGVSASRSVAIEDSPRGLASASAAGVSCLVVPTDLTRDLEFPGALALEEDVSGILGYLGDLEGRTGSC
jgi:HAD superfamily hydrolase (TIGR01509 family)